jgi:rhamnogalacturonan endolyase
MRGVGGMRLKRMKKLLSLLLVLGLVLTSAPFSFAGDVGTVNLSEYHLVTGSDFEDGSTWGFAGNATTSAVTEGSGNKCLQVTGSGSGTRSSVKTFTATTEASVYFTLDWAPGDVSTAECSSEILFSDDSGKAIFRIIKAGGTSGSIKYGIGTSGTTISTEPAIIGVSATSGNWVTIKGLFDFNSHTISFSAYDKGSDTAGSSYTDLAMVGNPSNLARVSIMGNRASGKTLNFTTGLDNVAIYSKASAVPPSDISSIKTAYTQTYNYPTGTAKDAIISVLPTSLEVNLENGSSTTLNVAWDCAGYNPAVAGTYTFIGTLNIGDGSVATNGHNISASVTVTTTAAGGPPPVDGMTYLFGSNFEDLSVWNMSPSNDAIKPSIATEGGNHYLKAAVSGQSGTRTLTKTFSSSVTDSAILVRFDWKPSDVSTASNSSEILFKDSKGNPVFRLIKTGGVNGLIKYGLGTTGTDHSQGIPITGISTDGTWLSVEVIFDFVNSDVSLSIFSKNNPESKFEASNISLLSTNFESNIASLIIQGNRASGQSLTFETDLDNVYFYGSGIPAPVQVDRKIKSIKTSYTSNYTVEIGASKTDVMSLLPAKLDVYLEDDATRNLPINWESTGFDSSKGGTYTFTGTFNLAGITAIINPDNIKATIAVNTVTKESIPEIPGYNNAYYSTFGDEYSATPANWGFTTTADANLYINTENIGGNTTPKLQFTQTNQSGFRVATKNLTTPVNGDIVLARFDWYPGKVNDKGSNSLENVGELRILDSSKNIAFTLINTNNEPIKFKAGSTNAPGTDPSADYVAPSATSFTNPNAWYTIELQFDVVNNRAELSITDKSTGLSEEYSVSMDKVSFDGLIGSIIFSGHRTSGNNVSWTTYLDNCGVYYVVIPDNRITKVEKIPYLRVYVGSATNDINSIGLPQNVTVSLADGSKTTMEVKEWVATDAQWDSQKPGVYTFKGELADKEGIDNSFKRYATCYVNHRLPPKQYERQVEKLDRGVIALKADSGMFISWRLMADEYDKNVKFNLYRNNVKLNSSPLSVTNFSDLTGTASDVYKVETLSNGVAVQTDLAISTDKDYLSLPLQKPEGVTNVAGELMEYTANDATVGDLDGDGEYEVIVKWYPNNAIDSSQYALTGPTFFDAYKLDGTLLWRMDMGLNLTSGAHYNQFLVYDFDADGKSEMIIKTADGTTVYGATDGIFDKSKVICQIGNSTKNGTYVSLTGSTAGHITGGPEYMSVFNGATGDVIDTIDYKFPVNNNPAAWGDTWYNRSDRFVATVAFLDGETPSAVFGRGYYERTTFVTYQLVAGKLQEGWSFDTDIAGAQYRGLGNHQLSAADVDNDGCDEVISGSLTLDNDGKVLYAMDGKMNRERGSHGDALHVGVFEPDREGIHIFDVHEVNDVVGMEYHDGGTGETYVSIMTNKDTGRGLAANITSSPGYEFWGWGDPSSVERGSGVYKIKDGSVVVNDYLEAGLSINFSIYWDGDLLQELNDDTGITKFNESTGKAELVKSFENCASNNGTKANCNLQADILGDWREEVLIRSTDSSELKIYSTTIPTEYRIYTLMHDSLYRQGIAWQNVAYNQPPHISFYLGEDVKDKVLAGELTAPKIVYVPKSVPSTPPASSDTGSGSSGAQTPTVPTSTVVDSKTGEAVVKIDGAKLTDAFKNAQTGADGNKTVTIFVPKAAGAASYTPVLPAAALTSGKANEKLELWTSLGILTVPGNMLSNAALGNAKEVGIHIGSVDKEKLPENVRKSLGDKPVIQLSVTADGNRVEYNNPNSPVAVSIPYRPTAEELKNPENIVVWYIDGAGKAVAVPNGRYDPATGLVTFTTTHFSTYAVAYVVKNFADLTGYDWAKKQIEVLAAKGIIEGTSATTYEPGANITRADFIKLLVGTLELKGNFHANFTDVAPNAHYYEAVGVAKTLGIVNGTGKNMFKPNESISRQDMMVMVARAMKVAGKLGSSGSTTDLARYEDNKGIASYAVNGLAALAKEGVLVESSGKLNPIGKATRADVAALLYKVYYK